MISENTPQPNTLDYCDATQRSSSDFCFSEHQKINPMTAQGEQSCAVQMDMKQWAIKAGMWPNSEIYGTNVQASDYIDIVEAHAAACGWKQEGFDGMEIIT